MMVQRNIELELQALELINQQQLRHNRKTQETGSIVDKHQQEEQSGGIDSFEDKILKEVIKKSKEEYEALVKEKENEANDIEKHYSESHDSNVKMYDFFEVICCIISPHDNGKQMRTSSKQDINFNLDVVHHLCSIVYHDKDQNYIYLSVFILS